MTKLYKVWVDTVEQPTMQADGFEAGVYAIVGIDLRGGEYTLIHRFTKFNVAATTCGKIVAAGKKINDDLWEYRAPYGTQAWMDQEGGMVDQWQEHCDYEANAMFDYKSEAYAATALGLED